MAPVHHHTALPSSSPRIGRRTSNGNELQLADASAFVTLNGDSGGTVALGKAPNPAVQRFTAGGQKLQGGAQLPNGHARLAPQLPNGHARVATATARRAPPGASLKGSRRAGAVAAPTPQQRSAAARRLTELALHNSNVGGSGGGGEGSDSPLPVSTNLEFPVAAAAVAAVPWSAETGLQHPRACVAMAHLSSAADGPTNMTCGGGCGSSLSIAAQRALASAKASLSAHDVHSCWMLYDCVNSMSELQNFLKSNFLWCIFDRLQ